MPFEGLDPEEIYMIQRVLLDFINHIGPYYHNKGKDPKNSFGMTENLFFEPMFFCLVQQKQTALQVPSEFRSFRILEVPNN
jgi:hypothetical protein